MKTGWMKSETFKDSLQIVVENGNVDLLKLLVEEYPDANMQAAIEGCFVDYPLSKEILSYLLSQDTVR
jgi:hypothetical protein